MRLQTKHSPFLALIILLTVVFFFIKPNSVNNIPVEDPASQKLLDKVIESGKLNPDDEIVSLEGLNVSNYTEYKKDYVLAKLYEEKGNFEKAISIYEKLLNKNYPLKERVLFHYAYLNTKLGKDSIALQYFNKLIREFPDSHSIPQAKYYLAQTQLRLRWTKDALNNLSSLKEKSPKTQYGIAANYYLGEDSYNHKNYSEAIRYWKQYLRFSPDGRFVSEIADFFSKLKPYLKPDDYSLLGDVFFYKKDYLKAAQYYKTGNNSHKYYNLGYSLFRTGKTSEAYNYLKEYSYHFPKSKNAKLSLLLASKSIPYYSRKSFWEKVEKDIPSLAYYAIYKQTLLENSQMIKEHKLKRLISTYPDTEFTLDAVWEIVWDKIQDKRYADALEIGDKYFTISKDSIINSKSEIRAKIGFWLGKICEVKGDKEKAKEYYKQTQEILFDNYYSFRASERYNALNGEEDRKWNIRFNPSNVNESLWSIPPVVNYEAAKRHFGVTIAELIKLHQYNEAIDLIGKSKFPSKQTTAWLKALNSEYDSSINISAELISNYSHNPKNQIWKLAYPLHFWQYIFTSCSRYRTLDPFLVCAVIRQESRYDRFACSISNACGLMQLIIPTAKTISRELKINISSRDILFDPQTNIIFGVYYLNGLINEMGNPLFAVASYNAGPNAVNNWRNKFNTSDLDFFVEEIPYDETRNYVKKVFTNYWTYLNLYNT